MEIKANMSSICPDSHEKREKHCCNAHHPQQWNGLLNTVWYFLPEYSKCIHISHIIQDKYILNLCEDSTAVHCRGTPALPEGQNASETQKLPNEATQDAASKPATTNSLSPDGRHNKCFDAWCSRVCQSTCLSIHRYAYWCHAYIMYITIMVLKQRVEIPGVPGRIKCLDSCCSSENHIGDQNVWRTLASLPSLPRSVVVSCHCMLESWRALHAASLLSMFDDLLANDNNT